MRTIREDELKYVTSPHGGSNNVRRTIRESELENYIQPSSKKRKKMSKNDEEEKRKAFEGNALLGQTMTLSKQTKNEKDEQFKNLSFQEQRKIVNEETEKLHNKTEQAKKQKEESYALYDAFIPKKESNKLDLDSKKIDNSVFDEIAKRQEFEKEYDDSKLKELSKNEREYIKENRDGDFFDRLKLLGLKTQNSIQAAKLIGGKTLLKEGEKVLDTGINALSKMSSASSNINTYLLDNINQSKIAANERKTNDNFRNSLRGFVSRDLTNELAEKNAINHQLRNAEKGGSFITEDNVGGKLVSGVTQMLPRIAISYLTGGAGVGTSSLNGLNGLDKAKQIAKNIGTTALNNAPANLELASSVYGGSLEEAYKAGATEEQATKYAIGKTATEIATEWITGGIPGTNGVGGLDILADKGIDKIGNSLARELTRYGYKMVGEGAEEALAEIMDPIIKNATYSKGEKVNWNNVLESAIYGGLTSGILELPSLASNINGINQNKMTNSTINTDNATQSVNNNPFTAFNEKLNNNSIQENIATNDVPYEYVKNDNSKIDNLRKSASQYLKNTDNTQSFVSIAEKLIADKNYNIILDPTVSNGKNNMVNAQIKKLDNGETEIRINPNSERAGEFLLVHEITHSIETNEMKKLVLDHASKNVEFNKAIESLKGTYQTKDVSSEVIADISGQLLGNQEFIDSLSTNKPNVFKRIYNSIISLANKVTGNSREALFMKDLENKWRTAYSKNSNNLSETAQFMMTGKKGMKNAIKADPENAWLKDNYKKSQEMFEKGISNERVRQKTGWFQGKDGKRRFEISDKEARLSKKTEKNKTYKLGEILKHDDLYELYPKLRNISIAFKNIDNKTTTDGKKYVVNGYFNVLTNTISLNNKIITNREKLLDTILHEIQHNIQKTEKFQGGTSLTKDSLSYENNLGEIEARDTSARKNMDYNERMTKTPRSLEPSAEIKFANKKNRMYNLDEVSNNDSKTKKMDRETLFQIHNKGSLRRGNQSEGRKIEYDQKSNQEAQINYRSFDLDGLDKSNKWYNLEEVRNEFIFNGNYKVDNKLSKGIVRENIHNTLNEKGLNNSSFNLKQKQLEIIKNSNPPYNETSTWIRKVEDVKTFEETLQDSDYKEYIEQGEDFDETYTANMAKEALDTGKITVYSSYPIKQGIFVTPSEMEAQSYSSTGKVFSKEVSLTDVAWIDPTQGQYAKVNQLSTSSKSKELSNSSFSMVDFNSSWQEHLEKNYKAKGTRTYFDTIKKENVNQNVNVENSNKASKGPSEFNENKSDDVLMIDKKSIKEQNQAVSKVSKDNKTAQLLEKRPERAKLTAKQTANDVIQEVVNKGHYVDKLAEKANNPEIKYKYDKMLSSQGEGHYCIGVAQTDSKGQKVGKSLIEIWKPVEKAKLVNEFSYYLLHKHNIDRYAQGKPVFGNDITSEVSQRKVDNYEKSYPQFKEWSEDINKYNKNNLKSMVEAGLTSAEAEEYYNNTYSNYIRIHRDITGSPPIQMTKDGVKVNSPIKKAKGGNQNILPLKDSMAQQTIEIKNAIRRNSFGLELLNTLNNGEDLDYDGTNYVAKTSDGESSFINKSSDGNYYFTVYKEGKPIKMEIDEGIYKALEKDIRKEWKFLAPIRKASEIHRSLLTVDNLLFALTNFFRDLGDAPLNSKYASKFAKNYIKAAKEIKTKGKIYQLYMANGGSQNTYFDYDKGVLDNDIGYFGRVNAVLKGEESKSKLVPTPKAFLNSIRNLNEAIEQAPRLAEFISTIEAGKSVTEAMYNAAEITTNFKRGGDLTKALNRNGANFLNASIQGFDKQIRNFTGQNGAKGYVNILLKATILGIAPSLLNDLLLGDDDDYEELPEYVKDSYFLFKKGDGKFIRIPKGRVTSIFGSAARRSLNSIKGKDDPWSGFGQQTINQVAPNNPLTDNLFMPYVLSEFNVAWHGGEIVPDRLQKELEKNQFDEKTDTLSKWLGEKLNYSPKKINYLLDQYSGGVGDVFLPLITSQARQNPLSAKFTTDSVLNNKNVSIFYDTAEHLEKVKNDAQASNEDILASKYMTSKKKEVSELYAEKRKIQNSKLKNDEKYERAREKQKEINIVTTEALKNYKKIKFENRNYAIVGEFKYKKNKDGSWEKQRSKK